MTVAPALQRAPTDDKRAAPARDDPLNGDGRPRHRTSGTPLVASEQVRTRERGAR